MPIYRFVGAGVLLACSGLAVAEPVTVSMAQTGFSGVLRTPHAEVLDFADLSLNYHIEEHIDHSTSYTKGAHKTLLLGVGLLPHLEISVQNTFKKFNGETGWNRGHSSDLSFSAKYEFSYFIPEDWFSLAVGFQDYGGVSWATVHQNAYGVVSKSLYDFRLSVGFGKGSERNQMGRDYLDGVFGGVEYQAFDWLQLVADYDGTGGNVGAKLFAPQQWLPYGWQANVTWQAYSSSDTHNRDNQWLGLGLTMPLAGPNRADRYQARGVEPWRDERATTQLQQANVTPTSAQQQQDWQGGNEQLLATLLAELASQGFENISLSLEGEVLHLAYENNVFNWNELDGLGVVLGLITDHHHGDFTVFVLNQKIPVLQVSGQTKQYLAFLQQQADQTTKAAPLTVNQASLNAEFDKVAWQQTQLNDSAYKLRLIFAPSYYSFLGTEMGVLDYSLALSSNVQMQLWQGASIDVRHLLPITHSDDFDDGEYFAQSRHKNRVDRALFHQGFLLPQNTLTQFSAGLVRSHFVGAMNETRWQSPQGAHRFSAELGYFEHDKTHFKAKPALVNYRYHLARWDWALEVGGGRYWYGDKGFTLSSKHWFGDTSVSLTYQNTDEQFAGMTFSVPITLQKDMTPTWLQVRGIDEWSLNYRTMVGNDKCNCLNGSLATPTGLQHNLARVYDNRDRLSAVYVETNATRLKSAYWQFVAQE
ncbi:YjbH domain-containing protein [Motilimonas eburnea]|uniref:YjbH domain-containing protein n=1 Tax=Motilimonas eburnea TaxID=1737488 RepID=UPI001E2D4010|nr:YjbH domain-containing protein [Motilimonas eburnea]MCE2573596.1 YjbH domain-containing protein [Motilimonas eburnea]